MIVILETEPRDKYAVVLIKNKRSGRAKYLLKDKESGQLYNLKLNIKKTYPSIRENEIKMLPDAVTTIEVLDLAIR